MNSRFFNQFAPAIAQMQLDMPLGAVPPAVVNGGLDDQIDALFKPQQPSAPTLYADAENQPVGILADPNSVRALGEAWGTALSGLKSSQHRAQKQRTYDDRHEFWDELAGRVLFPVSGAIPGNSKHANEASKALLDDLAERRKARRQDQAEQMRLVNNLAKVIKEADPDDLDRAMEQQKLDLKERQENRFFKQFEAIQNWKSLDSDLKERREQRYAQKQSFEQQTKTFYKQLATHSSERADKWLAHRIDAENRRLDLDERRLQEQHEEALRRNDRYTASLIERQMDSLSDERNGLYKLQYEAEQEAWRQQKDAAAVDSKGQPRYPGLQPNTGKAISDKALTPRMAPIQPTSTTAPAPSPARVNAELMVRALGVSRNELLRMVREQRTKRAKSR